MRQSLQYSSTKLANNCWWIYQKERFPLFKYGFLIAIFSGSAISYSQLLQNQNTISLRQWFSAFLVTLGFFLQMRIADEFKDYQDDCQYRPERAVPRGLVRLQELGQIGIFIGIAQLVITSFFIPQTLFYLCLVWGYFALMCLEFGCRKWLTQHLSIYMLSHMVILPLIGLFNLTASGEIQSQYWLFCLVCFLNGLIIEIGRKIRAPKDERLGVKTYSSIWTPKIASLVWLSCILLSAIATLFSSFQINFISQASIILIPSVCISIHLCRQFIQKLDTESAKKIDQVSAIWILISYFSLGLLPLLMHPIFN